MDKNNTTKFWSFVKSKSGEAVELWLYGQIASESWWDDEVTPKEFNQDLRSYLGSDIVVRINSPGGDAFAGAAIYAALKEHNGTVVCKVDGLAASAASVVAMAGDEIVMSPTATIMIHNPWSYAVGDSRDMEDAAEKLNEIKEGMVSAYVQKTGKSREEIWDLMDAETWLSAEKAVEMGFADRVEGVYPQNGRPQSFAFSSRGVLPKRTGISIEEKEERERILSENKEIKEKYERMVRG